MIDLSFVTLDLLRVSIQNFTLIAVLVLFYNFIPDTFRERSKYAFPLSVGLIFGLAAAISIPSLWQATSTTVIGFNIILVPLAGFIGGPVSSVFVAAVLLGGSAASSGSLSATDILTVMCGILLGAFFFFCRSWNRFPRSSFIQLFFLGSGIALIEIGLLVFSLLFPLTPGSRPTVYEIVSFLPFVVISWGGTIVLGTIIGFIDQKKLAEKELRDHKDCLEGLVKERTLELKKANSLQKATIESTADGIVVVDRDGVIRAYNQKASHILDLPAHLPVDTESYGVFTDKIEAFLSDLGEFLRLITPLPDSAEQFVTTNLTFTDGRIYELYVHPQRIGDNIVGRVWSFHDITDRRHAEEALAVANNKLILLSNITRHDIFNQITALSCHLDLLGTAKCDPEISAHLNSMEKILEIIRFQLEFTRDYQDLGLKKPAWQDAGAAFTRAAESYTGKNIVFSCETGHVEIFSDPMLGQVFYNLMDNSLRHGEHVTEIRLSVKKDDPDLIFVYEDNGVGVLPEEKEKIFLKGYGKHTGLGMFLITEILSITGIAIRETGICGQGVRFEIRVPVGKFRFV
ncbi:MAG: ATP-binding protein [Methanoregula sp.]|nr:ATP-binding protein [Methanoregula sp.]